MTSFHFMENAGFFSFPSLPELLASLSPPAPPLSETSSIPVGKAVKPVGYLRLMSGLRYFSDVSVKFVHFLNAQFDVLCTLLVSLHICSRWKSITPISVGAQSKEWMLIARTLGQWVPVPLEARMFVFVCLCG